MHSFLVKSFVVLLVLRVTTVQTLPLPLNLKTIGWRGKVCIILGSNNLNNSL